MKWSIRSSISRLKCLSVGSKRVGKHALPRHSGASQLVGEMTGRPNPATLLPAVGTVLSMRSPSGVDVCSTLIPLRNHPPRTARSTFAFFGAPRDPGQRLECMPIGRRRSPTCTPSRMRDVAARLAGVLATPSFLVPPIGMSPMSRPSVRPRFHGSISFQAQPTWFLNSKNTTSPSLSCCGENVIGRMRDSIILGRREYQMTRYSASILTQRTGTFCRV